MPNRPLTGDVAVAYMGSLLESAKPGRAGLNAAQLRADALAAARSSAARGRLRLASCRAAYRLPGYVGFAPARKWQRHLTRTTARPSRGRGRRARTTSRRREAR